MTTFVETIFRCDRPGCQTQETRPGAAGGAFPPVGWAVVTVSEREAGVDGKNVGCREDYELCPNCVVSVLAILRRRIPAGGKAG